ncbi:IS1380 family transposase [Pseudonocardia sp. WMMC193]|uniref:IS1380 family transposase n=1 Tax=Pseudonocardia sp. WMMC193 TaxID=2911965 RepID=UPI001F031291|nr:IS1380 family transposase [Pseudonocardia sp. WMMC193]MCF7552615.1 IS1380 family transposase [Pseudonocardia sp. WMMC193]
MKKTIGFYPCPDLDTAATTVVSHAGARLLTETIAKVGLDRGLSGALGPWRPRLAVHDPAKVLLDLALTLAVGGDCLSDIALLRAEPALFGSVASDPTVSRTIDRLAADAAAVSAAIDTARAAARAQAWALAGDAAPDHDTDMANPLVIDVDATLVTAHSDKQGAAPTFKKGFGHHPLWAFADHGAAGTGEPLAALLRPGNAGSNTAADHITVIRSALRQLPDHRPGNRPGRKVLIRVDGAGASHELLDWLHGQRLSYSVGFGLTQALVDQLAALPAEDWQTALDADREPRPGAWVIEATGLMNLASWPDGMRVIVRRERPHPGAQLRITDPDGLRYTAFATNTRPGGPGRQLADLELRHRRRARVEDRIRAAKDTGLTNLPLHELDQNRIWQAVVALACEITAWAQMLAYTDHPARRWEPKRLRLRLFSIPAQRARHARRTVLHLPAHAPWAGLLRDGLTALHTLAVPG